MAGPLRIPVIEKKYRFNFTTPLLGTSPLDPKVYEDYIAVNAPFMELGDEEVEMMKEAAENNVEFGEKAKEGDGKKKVQVTGFHSDSDGIYLLDYQIVGFIKEAGNNLKDILGIPNLKDKITKHVFVFPRFIWLADKPAERLCKRSIRAMTAQGPRTGIAVSQYVDPPLSIDLTIKIIPHPEICRGQDPWLVVETLLDYGQFIGEGQWRNASHGRFEWDILDDSKANMDNLEVMFKLTQKKKKKEEDKKKREE